MSAEVAKKRGRPKKVISDPVEVELTESAKKATTRAKSTKSAPKPTKVEPATGAKAAPVKKSALRAPGTSAASKTVGKTAAAPAKAVGKPVVTKQTPTTPTTSKILEQVKELEAKKATVSQESTKGTTTLAANAKVELAPGSAKDVERSQQQFAAKKSTEAPNPQPTITAKAIPTTSQTKSIPSSKPPPSPAVKSTPPLPPKSTPPPPSAKPTPTPKPQVPLAELNSKIVSNISTRAGARPNTSSSQQLPKNYKPVARKVTMAIVALPIAIVTSYVLYQRLVLGEGKKRLVLPTKQAVYEETKVESIAASSSPNTISTQASRS